MKEITIIFFCTWKFAATFPLAVLAMKMSFIETLIYTNAGGILGVLIFAFFSDILIRTCSKYWPEKLKFFRKSKKVFKKSNRRLVTLKMKYGLPGIVILTPVLLSIPVGTFLVTKYYGTKKLNLFWLIAGNVCWSFIYIFFYTQIA
ncbi:MAG: hypothetical protein JW973_08970 [Bacteroidales bacterium]|nr:hypothetical protein [Bacteroidales bacterium]